MRQVFRKPSYCLFALLIALLFYALYVWLPLRTLFAHIDALTAAHVFLAALIDPLSKDAWIVALLSVLVGVNAGMLLFYFRRSLGSAKAAAASGIAGSLIGIAGFGCAACGSLFVTSLISWIFGVGAAAALPQRSLPFELAAVMLLFFSVALLQRAIAKPLICES